MPWIIDSHEDLAFNILALGRDYLRSAHESRRIEQDTNIPEMAGGHTLIGWPEYQLGQVALVFGTLFIVAERYRQKGDESQVYHNEQDARRLYQQQIEEYLRLAEYHPDQFRLVRNQADLKAVLSAWEEAPAEYPTKTHPVGLVISMEGAEGLGDPGPLEEYWEMGLRLVGPVWGGGQLCGGTKEPGGFTKEGRALLSRMAELGYTLDISHMNDQSALEALDLYPEAVIASHANARALLKDISGERHLTDQVIRRLIERDGVMGVIPFNAFLYPGWKPSDDRALVTLDTLAAHIDHICQLAGDAHHAALGTDFDGGFGWPSVPLEINTIADLQKLEPLLTRRGYRPEETADILGGNWRRLLERTLPEHE